MANYHIKGDTEIDNSGVFFNDLKSIRSYQFTKNLTVTTDWQDTGISADNIPSGVYAISITHLQVLDKVWQYNGIWGGIIVWYSDYTNSEDTCEFPLYSAHHANNGNYIYIRTIGSPAETNKKMRLQIKGNCVFRNCDVIFYLTKLA